jgi:hypothetical protein
MKVIAPERVIAIDLHPLSFGYAMFEGPEEVLDWGIKSFRHGVNAVKVPLNVKLALLLDHYGPVIVVIKEPRTARLKKMVCAILNLAQCRRIPVQLISGASVRRAFPNESQNKYQIASVIAKRYPELSPRLGLRRKLWQAEKYSMSIFDAAAIGIAYFMRKATSDIGNDKAFSPLPR